MYFLGLQHGISGVVFLGRVDTNLHFFKENVNATIYQNQVLEGNLLKYIKTHNHNNVIFKHDHARPHKSNIADKWLENHFGHNRFLIIKKHRELKFYAPAKMADVWWIERAWAAMIPKVYKEPLPRTIKRFRLRIQHVWRELDQKRIIRMIHETPARLDWISRNSGKVIPNTWSSESSLLACTCTICVNKIKQCLIIVIFF